LVEDIPHITNTESEMLVVDFSEKDVIEAIFQMKHNKALGPDGFPAMFYQVFWSLIKDHLMATHYVKTSNRSRNICNDCS
jgi:hypothetical protein